MVEEKISDIFISYSSKDYEWVSRLVQALIDCGFSVWWDQNLIPGNNFYKTIEAALNQVGCVVTVWSEHSVESDWVLTESEAAKRQGKLVQVVYQPVSIPLSFRAQQYADLQSWLGDMNEKGFQQLLRGAETVLKRPRTRTPRSGQGAFLQKFKPFGNGRHKQYWLAALALLIAIISGIIFLRSESVTIGNCSGQYGDIIGSTINLDCSQGN